MVVPSFPRHAAYHKWQNIMISVATVTFVSERCPDSHDQCQLRSGKRPTQQSTSGSSGNVLVEKIKSSQLSPIETVWVRQQSE
jgi:hypothetical protein